MAVLSSRCSPMWPTRARRHQLQDRVEHPEPGAQHRHDDDVGRDAAPFGRPERRLDGHGRRGQVAGRLGRQQQADPDRHPAEDLRRRPRVAQGDERVVHERMFDDVDGHAAALYIGECRLANDDWGLR